jgi:S1-C subfamily serine protease
MAGAGPSGYNAILILPGPIVRHSILVSCLVALAAPLSAQANPSTPPDTVAVRAPVATGYGAWFGSIPNMDGATGGVLIDGTSAGSPAEKAGLKAGDRILSIAGVRMDELRSMAELLRTKVPGDTVEVLFQRRGTMEKVKVILGVRPVN